MKKRLLLVVIALIIVVGSIILVLNNAIIFSSTKATTPLSTPAISPTPMASPAPLLGTVILSPSNQTVSMYADEYQTNFNITIGQYENYNLKFPCYIGIISSQPPNGTGTSVNLQPTSYGTFSFSLSATPALKDKTITYYAVVKDSNGALIIGNTVQVKYI